MADPCFGDCHDAASGARPASAGTRTFRIARARIADRHVGFPVSVEAVPCQSGSWPEGLKGFAHPCSREPATSWPIRLHRPETVRSPALRSIALKSSWGLTLAQNVGTVLLDRAHSAWKPLHHGDAAALDRALRGGASPPLRPRHRYRNRRPCCSASPLTLRPPGANQNSRAQAILAVRSRRAGRQVSPFMRLPPPSSAGRPSALPDQRRRRGRRPIAARCRAPCRS